MGCTLAPVLAAGDGGVEVGVRTGYAVPIGDADGSTPLRDLVDGAIPFQLGVAWRLTDEFRVGGYGQYAYGFAGSAFDRVESASGMQLRLGLEVEWMAPPTRWRPWASVSAGWEWLGMSGDLVAQDGERVELEVDVNGPEAALAGGVLFAADSRLAVGPFLSLGLGRYENASGELGGQDLPDLVGQEKSVHGWLQLGVRGTFGN
ncbi:MAG TPA: hypothetical protein VD838_14305 [Anaeromyxobacteraceae bacterium]|nr:hypothetical protein [Anaeromyxobacteraceae bacterium]